MRRHDDSDDQPQPQPERSRLLPSDTFDVQLEHLIGLPNGAHTQPTVTQTTDFYGNTSSWMIQVVKTDEGEHAFLTLVTSAGANRFVVPPKVLAAIDRQRQTTVTMVRRRHGKRLAEERKARGEVPAFLRRELVSHLRPKPSRSTKKIGRTRKAR